MSYQDKWSRFHDKPCTNGEPSSNNGWVFSAYAAKAGLELDETWLGICYKGCRLDSSTLVRSPGDEIGKSVPISRDEILGLVALGFLVAKKDSKIAWNFSPYPLPKLNLFKLFSQLWQLFSFEKTTVPLFLGVVEIYPHLPKLKNRNYFWQNNLDQIYRFAFSIPLVDRYFILKKWNRFCWYKPSHLFYFAVSLFDRIGSASGLKWLKYGGQDNKKAMVKEFPEDHPIRVKLGL